MKETLEHVIAHPKERTRQTPLFLLHGAWVGVFYWENFLHYLPTLGYEVHALSLPGHGKSSLAKGHINKYSLQDYVDCLAEEIAKVSPRPVLLGHSMGGFVTQKYLEAQKLPGAVLLASVPHTGSLRFTLKLLRRYPLRALRALLTRDGSPFGPEIEREISFSPDTTVDMEKYCSQMVPESMKVNGELSFSVRIRTEKISTPILVIAAENDFIFSVAEEKRLAAALSAKFIVMPGQAHVLMLEPAWKEVADLIHAWITEERHLP